MVKGHPEIVKIAILTNLAEFNPAYSLCSIVESQARMLARYGHDVTIFVSESCNLLTWPVFIDGRITVETRIPDISERFPYLRLADLTEQHNLFSAILGERLRELLLPFGAIFTHDWILTGWHLPYAEALAMCAGILPRTRFFHWIHSIPNTHCDWWRLYRYGTKNHKIVYPNQTDRAHVALQFNCLISDVVVVPHIVDPRIFLEFNRLTNEFIDDYPSMLQAEIVQVYPASSDRLRGKGVDRLINIFAELKRRGKSVCLVIANQWANKLLKKEDLDWYRNIAERNGLDEGDFVFTGDWRDGEFESGIPRRMLRELMSLSNLFVAPTMSESFFLALPEASLAGCVLPIQNASLYNQREVGGNCGVYREFGSWQRPWNPRNEGDYYRGLADLVLQRMNENEAVRLKTHIRQSYNMDAVYEKYYRPMLAEGNA
jgi:glycosyltransferase involved in cell wall biosynthesis